ncbi:MAG TPA: gluconate kinase [Cyanobacteria bacterium UBA8803]|nr:gluconate kinase [Cyanobacteria bacterium UBA9273]HBL60537.1 gluconate kinase [Cyanobacteria bacterium UBA8803]
MDCFIGVDVGTTSTKAIVFSPLGSIKGMANYGYPLLSPQPGWSEQEPGVIFEAVLGAVREAIAQADVSGRDIAAVGFGTAMHSLIVMDAQHECLTNSIVWADSRSLNQAERLKQDGTGLAIYQRTGTPIHPMSPLTKLLWMREQDLDTFRQAAKFISIKEFIFYQLFERYVVDYAIASATGLFNLEQLSWDGEVLQLLGIRPDQLSELVPTTYILRGMKTQWAKVMGLHADTPIVVGASDGVLANLGVGAIAPDQMAVTIGTSGAVRQGVPHPLLDREGRTFCYLLTANHWVIGGASNSGGIVLRWFRDRFGMAEIEQAKQQGVDPYEVMIQVAQTVPAGAEGLLFLPFLSGERAPYWNPDARGVFFGIGLHHQRAHFIRAVLEGILFSAYSIRTLLGELTGDSQTILASGGFARSGSWLQMMADLFGCEVLVPQSYEASSFGAAVLAMYAVGVLSDLSQVRQLIHICDRHQPNLELSQRYHKLFGVYQRIYSNLVDEFANGIEFKG